MKEPARKKQKLEDEARFLAYIQEYVEKVVPSEPGWFRDDACKAVDALKEACRMAESSAEPLPIVKIREFLPTLALIAKEALPKDERLTFTKWLVSGGLEGCKFNDYEGLVVSAIQGLVDLKLKDLRALDPGDMQRHAREDVRSDVEEAFEAVRLQGTWLFFEEFAKLYVAMKLIDFNRMTLESSEVKDAVTSLQRIGIGVQIKNNRFKVFPDASHESKWSMLLHPAFTSLDKGIGKRSKNLMFELAITTVRKISLVAPITKDDFDNLLNQLGIAPERRIQFICDAHAPSAYLGLFKSVASMSSDYQREVDQIFEYLLSQRQGILLDNASPEAIQILMKDGSPELIARVLKDHDVMRQVRRRAEDQTQVPEKRKEFEDLVIKLASALE